MANEALDTPDIELTVNPASAMAFSWDDQVIGFRAASTGQQYILRQWGFWTGTYEWLDVPQRDAELLRAQFSFYGRHTPYKIVDVLRVHPRGTFSNAQLDNVRINGTLSTGQTLALTTGVANTPLFLAGDLVKIASTGEIYEVVGDWNTDSGGNALVKIAQFIRQQPQPNEVVITRKVAFRMRSKTIAMPTVGPGVPMYSFSVQMVEAL